MNISALMFPDGILNTVTRGLLLVLVGLCTTAVCQEKPENVDELIHVIESGNKDEVRTALRQIIKLGPQATKAVDAIIAKVDSVEAVEQAAAIGALVAIGDGAVEPLRKLLSSESPRARMAAVQGLGRLNAITVKELAALINDPADSVRGSVAVALGDIDESAPSLLLELLNDKEPRVVFEACLSIREKQPDAKLAVPALTALLKRRKIAAAAMSALGKYGTDARSALPELLANAAAPDAVHHERGTEFLGGDGLYALEEIGPPFPADVPAISKLLQDDNPKRVKMVAESLGWLGPDAAVAADDLEKAAQRLIDQFTKNSPQKSPQLRLENPGLEWKAAARHCVLAFALVTEDPKRFVPLIERFERVFQGVGGFNWPSPWKVITEENVDTLKLLTSSDNPYVFATGVKAALYIGPPAKGLTDDLVAALRGNVELLAPTALALARLQGENGREILPVLIESYQAKRIDIGEFARAIMILQIHSAEIESILSKGLESDDKTIVSWCAATLCSVSPNSPDAVKKVIEAIEKQNCSVDMGMYALGYLKVYPPLAIDYFVQHLSDREGRVTAARVIGRAGKAANMAVKPLTALVHEEDLATRLYAAASLSSITSDLKPFDELLGREFSEMKASDYVPLDHLKTMIESIQGLDNDARRKVQHHFLDNMGILEKTWIDLPIKCLVAIGSPESILVLERLAESKSWQVRSLATDALERIKNDKR